MRKEKLIYLINKWIDINEQLKQINKYLFDHTELFEEKYTTDYNWDLYNFFAKKITRFGRDYSELRKILNYKDKQKIITLEYTIEEKTLTEEIETKESFEKWAKEQIRGDK